MNKFIFFALFLFSTAMSHAQLVEVQANYNNVGDVDFVAYNNSPAPLYLNLDFADLENTVFREPLPYICLSLDSTHFLPCFVSRMLKFPGLIIS